MSELNGQTSMDLFNGAAGGLPEGYDGEGRLLNEEYGTACAPEPAPEQTGAEVMVPAESEARLEAIAAEIAAVTEQTRAVLAGAAISIGRRLIEAKGLLPEGRWTEWLRSHVDYSPRQAQVMMQLAEQFGREELPEAYRGLGISHLTALLAAPAEEREAMARRATEEDLSVRELKKEIQALKIEKAKDQMKIDALDEQLERAKGNIRQLESEGSEQDRAIVERDEKLRAAEAAINREKENAMLARANASAAEASAEELRKLRADAEERAEKSAQRATDAVNRANRAAAELRAAKEEIERLKAASANAGAPSATTDAAPPPPERKDFGEADAGEPSGSAGSADAQTSAVGRFRDFYRYRMNPDFKEALLLLKDVEKEDAKAAEMFATALIKGCRVLMGQITGAKESDREEE